MQVGYFWWCSKFRTMFLIVLMMLGVDGLSVVNGYSTERADTRNTSAIKAFFTNPIVNDLIEFPYFRQKFDVPYLDVTTALTYAKEIARASALHPLFHNKLRVEELVLERLLRTFLPSSEDYCTSAESSASRIGDIITDIGIDRGLFTNRTSETAMRLYAGYISGTVLMRLSKLPDPKSDILERLNNNSTTVSSVPKLIRLLSAGLKNSSYVSGFYDDGELDSRKSKVLSSAISGSTYLGYNLSTAKSLSQAMEKNFRSSKGVLGGRLKQESRYLLVPAVIAESVISCMLDQGVTVVGKVDEVFDDVLKLIKLGITMDRMNLSASKNDVKYSFD